MIIKLIIIRLHDNFNGNNPAITSIIIIFLNTHIWNTF